MNPDSLDLDVDRNVHAERPVREGEKEMVAAEHPRRVCSRQLLLGENLDTKHIDAGVLKLTIP